jgi:hypothetical protein
MFFSRWFGRDSRRQGRGRPGRPIRPTLECLEDRTTPSSPGRGLGLLYLPASGPAAHLEVIIRDDVRAGSAFDVVVLAEDASNRPATAYSGTVDLTLDSAGAGTTLLAEYTFTARDHGVHVFVITLAATGSQTVTATDTSTPSIAGSATTTVTTSLAATQLVVGASAQADTGVLALVTTGSLGASARPASDTRGSVSLVTSDGGTNTLADLTSIVGEQGLRTVAATSLAAGPVRAADSRTGLVSSHAPRNGKSAPDVPHLDRYFLDAAAPGLRAPVSLTALDASNQPASGSGGSVPLTGTNRQATLPAEYGLLASDDRARLFWVTYVTVGQQPSAATQPADNSITTSARTGMIADLLRRHAIFGGGLDGWWASSG